MPDEHFVIVQRGDWAYKLRQRPQSASEARSSMLWQRKLYDFKWGVCSAVGAPEHLAIHVCVYDKARRDYVCQNCYKPLVVHEDKQPTRVGIVYTGAPSKTTIAMMAALLNRDGILLVNMEEPGRIAGESVDHVVTDEFITIDSIPAGFDTTLKPPEIRERPTRPLRPHQQQTHPRSWRKGRK